MVLQREHSPADTLILFFQLLFSGVQLLYNVVLLSAVQQSESVIRIHTSPLFFISFPSGSPQSTQFSSLCYTVGSHQLSILYMVSIEYICPFSLPIHPTPPFPLGSHTFYSLHWCLYFCFANKIIYTVFLGFPGGARRKGLACQCKRQETQVPSLSWEDPLEEGMATHSSILAWKIPWIEEPGGQQFMGLQRVRHE